jgi:hypothetical protein
MLQMHPIIGFTKSVKERIASKSSLNLGAARARPFRGSAFLGGSLVVLWRRRSILTSSM